MDATTSFFVGAMIGGFACLIIGWFIGFQDGVKLARKAWRDDNLVKDRLQ